MIPAFATNLRGRMPPALFSEMPFAKRARFPGDPYPTFAHMPWWFWMHSDACREASKDTPYAHAICRDKQISQSLLEHERRDSQQVLKATATRPDATDRETPVNTSPVGGPMGLGQLAAASATQRELFARHAS